MLDLLEVIPSLSEALSYSSHYGDLHKHLLQLEKLLDFSGFSQTVWEKVDLYEVEKVCITLSNLIIKMKDYYSETCVGISSWAVLRCLINLCYIKSSKDESRIKEKHDAEFKFTKHIIRYPFVENLALFTARRLLKCNRIAEAEDCLKMAKDIVENSKPKDNQQDLWEAYHKNLFIVNTLFAELYRHQLNTMQAFNMFQIAKDIAINVPQCYDYLCQLSYNFGIDAMAKRNYEESISWLRQSFDVGKLSGADPEALSRTLRILADTYLHWDGALHWERALHAVQMAETFKKDSSTLKLKILLTGKQSTENVKKAVEELLESNDLTNQTVAQVLEILQNFGKHEIAHHVLKKLKTTNYAEFSVVYLKKLLDSGLIEDCKNLLENVIFEKKNILDPDVSIVLFNILAKQAFNFQEQLQYELALQWYEYCLIMCTDTLLKGHVHQMRCFCFICISKVEEANEEFSFKGICGFHNKADHYLSLKLATLTNDIERLIAVVREMDQCKEGCTLSGHMQQKLLSLAIHSCTSSKNESLSLVILNKIISNCPSEFIRILAIKYAIYLIIKDADPPNEYSLIQLIGFLKEAYEILRCPNLLPVHAIVDNGIMPKIKESVETAQQLMAVNCLNTEQEIEWFSKAAWNAALQCKETFFSMHNFFLMSAQFLLLGYHLPATAVKTITSLSMAAAAGLHALSNIEEKDQKDKLCRHILEEIEQCQEMMNKEGMPDKMKNVSFHKMLLLYKFEAFIQLQDPGIETVLEETFSLPQVDAGTFEKMATISRLFGGKYSIVPIRALKAAIKKHLEEKNPNFEAISKNYHSLIKLTSEKYFQLGSNSEDLWKFVIEVADIIKSTDQYPEVEVLWLICRIWNIGIKHLEQENNPESALKWCSQSFDLLEKIPTFRANYISRMEVAIDDIKRQLENK